MNIAIQFIVYIEIALVLQRCAAGGTFEAINMKVLFFDAHKNTTKRLDERKSRHVEHINFSDAVIYFEEIKRVTNKTNHILLMTQQTVRHRLTPKLYRSSPAWRMPIKFQDWEWKRKNTKHKSHAKNYSNIKDLTATHIRVLVPSKLFKDWHWHFQLSNPNWKSHRRIQ